MNKFIKPLISIIILFSLGKAVAAPVKLEVKTFGKDIVFVFYHDDKQVIHLQSRGSQVVANINIPVQFSLTNPSTFNQYAFGLKQTNGNQIISFNVIKDLKYQTIINGEKLDAIKFRSGDKEEILQEPKQDLTTISAANNDPDAVTYSIKGDEHQLNFNLGNNNSKAAAFIRGKYLWIVFDQKKIFTFKEQGIFSNFSIVPSENGTVIRVKLAENFANAKLAKTNNGWVASVTNSSTNNYLPKQIIAPSALVDQEGFSIKGNFTDSDIISFEDPEVGDIIKTIPTSTVGLRVNEPKEAVEFSILKSAQGVVVSLTGEEVELKKFQDEIRVASQSDLADDGTLDANLFPTPIEDLLTLPTILPYLDKNLDILDFNQRKSQLISDASEAQDDEEAFKLNLELAKFYFIHEWYHECGDVLEHLKQKYRHFYDTNLQARFLNAVTHTLIGETLKAKEEYDALLSYHDVKKMEEVNLWNKYNSFSFGNNPGSLGFISNLGGFVSLYSNDKYWPIAFAEIEMSLLANDLKAVEKLFKDLRTPPEGKYSNSLKYYKANLYRKKNQENLAKQFLLDLTYREEDLFNSVRAEFELSKLKIKSEEIDMAKAIEILEGLRFKWRGDQLEYEILLQLATYYKDGRDVLNALRTYKYIQTAFSNKVSNFFITSEMAKIFNEVFLPGGIGKEMDDFTLVALFYEFRELNPIGDKGDDVILEIARRLVLLDLLDNAEDLLRHQIKFRLKGEKRVINADNLAVILMADNKPREAMLVLDDTDKDNFNFEEHKHRSRLRARAMIDLEKYDDAIEFLKDDDSSDGEIIRREALFKAQKWSDYADLVSKDLDNLIAKVATDAGAKQDILRLAMSYYMLNSAEQLQAMAKAVDNSDPILKNTIDLLSTSSEQVDIMNLDKSLNVNQMQTLLDKYKNQFLEK